MGKGKNMLLMLILTVMFYSSHAQNNFSLAMEYFRNREWEKAESILAELLQQKPDRQVFQYYLLTLGEQKKGKEIEQAAKNQKRLLKTYPDLLVDLGTALKTVGELKKSEKYYDEVHELALSDATQFYLIANRFINLREFDRAEKLYLEAKKRNQNQSYDQELANLYFIMRNYEKMIDIYLNLLVQSDAYVQMVQNRLNTSIYGDKTLTQLLERKLIRKIQENPNRDVFYELLLWNYLQDNDYANAYIQARALDFRKRTPGVKLLPLAIEASEAGDFATALKALDDIIEAGEQSDYYIEASLQKLEVMYQRIKKNFDFTPENIQNTLDFYAQAIQRFGLSPITFTIAIQYCELLTHYGDRLKEAMQLLDQLDALRGLSIDQRAKIELQKADVYLFLDKLWDAALIYSKVERQNKENPIGSEAKFRKAKTAFYQHQFEWAKSQIDVLKASTEKLTANDAVELSIHLYEGWSEIDSTQQELKTFASALLRYEQQRIPEALVLLDSLSKCQNSYLAVEASNLKAKILLNQRQYKQALDVLRQTVSRYSFETNIDQTLYMAGVLMIETNNEPEEGAKLLTRLLKSHPSSIYCVEARQKLQKSKNLPQN